MALSSDPKLLLLDEPTTALDSASKEGMISLLKSLQEKMGFAMLFVTHDMGAASALCEDICVIRHGRIVETGPTARVVAAPSETYTKALIDAEFKNRGFRI
jgi:peptide/nickel transport system ATP-binding protein